MIKQDVLLSFMGCSYLMAFNNMGCDNVLFVKYKISATATHFSK